MSFIVEAYAMEPNSLMRDFAIMEESINLDFAKIDNMFAMVESQLDIITRECELKVVRESGDLNDLRVLYEAATNEANDKKKGIFATAVDKIVSACKSIRNFVAEKLLGMDVGDKVEMDSSEKTKYDNTMSAKVAILNLITKLKSGAKCALSEVMGVLITVGKLLAPVAVTGMIIKISKAEWNKMVKNSQDATTAIEASLQDSVLDKLENLVFDDDDGGTEAEKKSVPKKIIDTIKGLVNSILDVIRGMGKAVKDHLPGHKKEGKENDKKDGKKEEKKEKKNDTTDDTKASEMKPNTDVAPEASKGYWTDGAGKVHSNNEIDHGRGSSPDPEDEDDEDNYRTATGSAHDTINGDVMTEYAFGVDYSAESSLAEFERLIDAL